MEREYIPTVEVKSSGLDTSPDVIRCLLDYVVAHADEAIAAVAAQRAEAEHGAGRADV